MFGIRRVSAKLFSDSQWERYRISTGDLEKYGGIFGWYGALGGERRCTSGIWWSGTKDYSLKQRISHLKCQRVAVERLN